MRDYPWSALITRLAFACAIAIFSSSRPAAPTAGDRIESAADAARRSAARGPLRHRLFAIGLFGASMLATGVLPLATAYAVTEALGFERGVSALSRGSFFVGLFTFLSPPAPPSPSSPASTR